jgi:hypothetical protein
MAKPADRTKQPTAGPLNFLLHHPGAAPPCRVAGQVFDWHMMIFLCGGRSGRTGSHWMRQRWCGIWSQRAACSLSWRGIAVRGFHRSCSPSGNGAAQCAAIASASNSPFTHAAGSATQCSTGRHSSANPTGVVDRVRKARNAHNRDDLGAATGTAAAAVTRITMLLWLSRPCFCREFGRIWQLLWTDKTGMGRSGRRAGSYQVTRVGSAGNGPGAAGGSFEGQHVCGSRLAGQAAPGAWRQPRR